MAKRLISKELSWILFIIANIGMISIILKYFDVWDINNYVVYATGLLLGIGLLIESQPKLWKRMSRRGFNSIEITHIITAIIGIFVIISSSVGLWFGNLPTQYHSVIGIAYVIALVMTWIERFTPQI